MKNFKESASLNATSEAMESKNHFKNAASLKSHTSRGNFYRWFGIITFVVFIGLSMASCGDGSSALTGGKWLLVEGRKSGNPESIELLKDGTGIVDKTGITWKTEKGRFYITNPFYAMSYKYKVSGSALTLTCDDGTVLKYKKQ
jgi:hypothetical protein